MVESKSYEPSKEEIQLGSDSMTRHQKEGSALREEHIKSEAENGISQKDVDQIINLTQEGSGLTGSLNGLINGKELILEGGFVPKGSYNNIELSEQEARKLINLYWGIRKGVKQENEVTVSSVSPSEIQEEEDRRREEKHSNRKGILEGLPGI